MKLDDSNLAALYTWLIDPNENNATGPQVSVSPGKYEVCVCRDDHVHLGQLAARHSLRALL